MATKFKIVKGVCQGWIRGSSNIALGQNVWCLLAIGSVWLGEQVKSIEEVKVEGIKIWPRTKWMEKGNWGFKENFKMVDERNRGKKKIL